MTVASGTRITSKEAVFLSKGQQVAIAVDGSAGASLSAANGTIVQVMTNDGPGPVQQNGTQANAGVYTEPTGLPNALTTFDTRAASSADVVATFTKIDLKGNLYGWAVLSADAMGALAARRVARWCQAASSSIPRRGCCRSC
ncbi:MAG TPA: hypothetical protein VI248_18140 [Kineosporiaceae bacterium]